MPRVRHGSIARVIFLSGLVAGTLDICDAIVFYGIRNHVSPIRIPQSIAAGLLGRAAFDGGMRSAALGLVLHYCIALAWAALFVLAARRISLLRREAVRSGVFYGLLIYAVMNYVVLPHSHAAPPPHELAQVVNGVLAIVLLVGLPISLLNRRLTTAAR